MGCQGSSHPHPRRFSCTAFGKLKLCTRNPTRAWLNSLRVVYESLLLLALHSLLFCISLISVSPLAAPVYIRIYTHPSLFICTSGIVFLFSLGPIVRLLRCVWSGSPLGAALSRAYWPSLGQPASSSLCECLLSPSPCRCTSSWFHILSSYYPACPSGRDLGEGGF